MKHERSHGLVTWMTAVHREAMCGSGEGQEAVLAAALQPAVPGMLFGTQDTSTTCSSKHCLSSSRCLPLLLRCSAGVMTQPHAALPSWPTLLNSLWFLFFVVHVFCFLVTPTAMWIWPLELSACFCLTSSPSSVCSH